MQQQSVQNFKYFFSSSQQKTVSDEKQLIKWKKEKENSLKIIKGERILPNRIRVKNNNWKTMPNKFTHTHTHKIPTEKADDQDWLSLTDGPDRIPP